MQAWTQRQTEFVKHLMTASGIALQSWLSACTNWSLLFRTLGRRTIHWPRWSHKCSVGDRSGGHGITLTLFAAKHCCTTRTVWCLALSCWTKSLGWCCRNGRRKGCIIWFKKLCAVRFPSVRCCLQIPPQSITDPPPNGTISEHNMELFSLLYFGISESCHQLWITGICSHLKTVHVCQSRCCQRWKWRVLRKRRCRCCLVNVISMNGR